MTRPLITILDDTREIRDLLTDNLTDAGFDVRGFARATEFERALRGMAPAICIIDLGLPDRDGLALINKVATETGAAILIISGRAQLHDKIAGLELGADDYITKPFEMAEVLARVRALMRRGKTAQPNDLSPAMRFSGWTVDLEQHLLRHDDGSVEQLSFAEGQVLRMFLRAPNRLITRDQMMTELGDHNAESYDRAIDVRVSRLRAKLRDDPNNPTTIKTIYGAGYIFIADVETAKQP